jgi:LacI family transcriptional regulator
MTSIRDVAEQAGVSTATVSHVINGTRPVMPETRRLVEDAVQRLNYRPNGVARGLQSNSTRTIGVLVANVTSHFFAQIVRELETAFESEHYNLIVCNTDEHADREQRYLDMLYERRVDGVVMVPTGAEQPLLRQFAQSGVPVVSIYRKPGTPCGPVVVTDEFASAYTATEHLIKLGHRRIGVLARGHNLTPVIYRVQGYMHALRDHGIPIDQRLIEINYRAPERTTESANRLFSIRPEVSAMISMSLTSSLSLLRAMRTLGVSYPGDVSVVGIGDAPWMEVLPAPLTVMAAPTQDMCRAAAQLTLARIAAARVRGSKSNGTSATNGRNDLPQPESDESIVFPARLVVRESCRAPEAQPLLH